jgi:plasmid replication initiation protein
LKLYEDTGKRVDNLDALRKKLECPKSYKKYSLFKQNVLRPAYEEINGNSDISFEYEEVKQKNKVTGLIFRIKTNNPNIKAVSEACPTLEGKSTNEQEKCPTELINKAKSIFKENITRKEAEFILNTAKGDINIIKEKYALSQNVSKIGNIVGWMIKAIKEDFTIPKYKVKVGSFNDYEQRDYDFDALEKKLLGWDNEEKIK